MPFREGRYACYDLIWYAGLRQRLVRYKADGIHDIKLQDEIRDNLVGLNLALNKDSRNGTTNETISNINIRYKSQVNI